MNAYGRRTHSAPVRTEERVVQRSRPEPLLARTTRWVLRHRGYVLGAWLVLLIGGGLASTRLGPLLSNGFAVPGTGIVLNNSHKWMDRDPDSPNALKPGRKGVTMMSPTQVFRDGRFELSIGTPGSYGILQTTPQMLLNVLEFGFNVQEAIEQPRVRVYRDRLIDAEARIPAATRDALAERGHQVNVIDDWSWIVGGGQGIARDPESGALMAGADPRRDGYALAI